MCYEIKVSEFTFGFKNVIFVPPEGRKNFRSVFCRPKGGENFSLGSAKSKKKHWSRSLRQLAKRCIVYSTRLTMGMDNGDCVNLIVSFVRR